MGELESRCNAKNHHIILRTYLILEVCSILNTDIFLKHSRERKSKDSGLEFMEAKKIMRHISARVSAMQQSFEVVITPILQRRKTMALIN